MVCTTLMAYLTLKEADGVWLICQKSVTLPKKVKTFQWINSYSETKKIEEREREEKEREGFKGVEKGE